MAALTFNRDFSPHHGKPVAIGDDLVRITANNRGPMTFEGTNTYLIGVDNLAIIDPGPIDDDHLQVILSAIGERQLSHIFVSHTHKDHSPLAAELKKLTGAMIYAQGPHKSARDIKLGEDNPLQESSDLDFVPDIELEDGQIIDGGDWRIEAVHTPGHTANHCAFSLLGRETLFSADHVMAWSTSMVGPPDGAMGDYMASLEKLIERNDRHILPGHGPEVIAPKDFLLALKDHRKARERSIVDTITNEGSLQIAQLVDIVYSDLDERLKLAASLSTLAHLEDLIAQGEIEKDDLPPFESHYKIA